MQVAVLLTHDYEPLIMGVFESKEKLLETLTSKYGEGKVECVTDSLIRIKRKPKMVFKGFNRDGYRIDEVIEDEEDWHLDYSFEEYELNKCAYY